METAVACVKNKTKGEIRITANEPAGKEGKNTHTHTRNGEGETGELKQPRFLEAAALRADRDRLVQTTKKEKKKLKTAHSHGLIKCPASYPLGIDNYLTEQHQFRKMGAPPKKNELYISFCLQLPPVAMATDIKREACGEYTQRSPDSRRNL